jgi:hypothetical protein
MPRSSSGAFSCTACPTASTASATTAFSPMAGVVTSLPSAASCSLSAVLGLIDKTSPILQSLKGTFLSAHVAAVSCDASMSCRPPANAHGHSVVIRHDHAFTDDRSCHRLDDNRLRRGLCRCCGVHPRTAGQADSSRILAQQIARQNTRCGRSTGPIASNQCPADARRPRAALNCKRPNCTIPIVPNIPRLRSIRLL